MLAARTSFRRSLLAARTIRLNSTQAAAPAAPAAPAAGLSESEAEFIDHSKLFSPNQEAAEQFIKTEDNIGEHAKHTANTWKNVSLFVCIPALIATAISTYYLEKKHHEHLAAHPPLPLDERPPEYEFQNVRNTKFFWGDGDKTLFWNDKVNFHKKE